jgi:hypothetical protein
VGQYVTITINIYVNPKKQIIKKEMHYPILLLNGKDYNHFYIQQINARQQRFETYKGPMPSQSRFHIVKKLKIGFSIIYTKKRKEKKQKR